MARQSSSELTISKASANLLTPRHLALLRWSMVAIFIWFGIQKFTPYAAEAIAPLIEHSPFMSWLSVFGVGVKLRL